MRTTHPWVPWLSIACMGTAAAAVPPIEPVPGLVLTTNVHSVVVANLRSFGYVDQEDRVSLVAHAVAASPFALTALVTEQQLASARVEIEASADRLDQARAQAQVTEALLDDARAREAKLLDALRALGAASRG